MSGPMGSGKGEVYFPSVSFDPQGADVPDDTFLVTFRARKCREVEDFKNDKSTIDADLLEIVDIVEDGKPESGASNKTSTDDTLDNYRDEVMGKSKKSTDSSDEDYTAQGE